jgi:hypothetical protein
VDRDHQLPLSPLQKRKRKKVPAAVEADPKQKEERLLIAVDVVEVLELVTVITMTVSMEVAVEVASTTEMLEARKKEEKATNANRTKTNGFTNSTRKVSESPMTTRLRSLLTWKFQLCPTRKAALENLIKMP